MKYLLGKSLDELQEIVLSIGLPRFAGRQMAEWLYKKRVTTIDEMTNISLKGREALSQEYIIGRSEPMAVAESADGTKKYLFKVNGGDAKYNDSTKPLVVECVYIPDDDRATLCVSTQAGCKMGCRFCMTGTLGFQSQLSACDILNQIFSIPESNRLTNLVYMGEGEPMDNIDNVLRSLEVMTSDYGCGWSPRRITVSSVGLIPGLQRFITESECHLAISLHNPFAAERELIMPIQKRYPLDSVINLIRRYDFSHQRRVSFEYIMFAGRNDTMRHAAELKRLLADTDCRINLIRFHSIGGAEFQSSDEKRMVEFRDYLTANGITTTIRRSRGEDIMAACGMLVNELYKI